MTPVRILLADDHTLVRAGIRSLLASIENVEVVGEASDGHEAVRQVDEAHPHLVLLDIMMPGLNGLEALARIHREHPEVRVIILSMNAAEEYVLQALRAGASGYLLKNVSPTELAMAVKAVAGGETYLSTSVSRHVIDAYLKRTGSQAGPLESLTSRQREILQLIAEGRTTKEIAKRLDLSVKTVETHRTQLMDRLGIHDIAGLVRFAIREGLIEPQA
jgi:DNA-binding NarL/FixJ family response regulator